MAPCSESVLAVLLTLNILLGPLKNVRIYSVVMITLACIKLQQWRYHPTVDPEADEKQNKMF